MKNKNTVLGAVVVSGLVALALFSTSVASNAGGSKAPTLVKGHAEFEYKDFFLPGEEESFSINVNYNSKNPDKGKATVKQGEQTLEIALDCIVPGPTQFPENSVGVAGKVLSVEGSSIHDTSFPSFRAPQEGDYAVVLVVDGGEGSKANPDFGSRAFVFGPPAYPGLDCEEFAKLSPPSTIFTKEIEKGNYQVKNWE